MIDVWQVIRRSTATEKVKKKIRDACEMSYCQSSRSVRADRDAIDYKQIRRTAND